MHDLGKKGRTPPSLISLLSVGEVLFINIGQMYLPNMLIVCKTTKYLPSFIYYIVYNVLPPHAIIGFVTCILNLVKELYPLIRQHYGFNKSIRTACDCVCCLHHNRMQHVIYDGYLKPFYPPHDDP